MQTLQVQDARSAEADRPNYWYLDWTGRGLGKAEGRKRRAGTDKQDTTVTESKTNQQSCHPWIRVVMLKHEHARNQDHKDL